MSIAVGIDLGTTNSCVSVYINGKVNIIENEDEKPTLPSFVYYNENEVVIGKLAEQISVLNPSNGIFDTKRMLGYKFDDEKIQNNLTKWPFTVTKADNGEPQIQITQESGVLNLQPEQISAAILNKLKKLASEALEMNIVNAVITVPAYFSNAQRQATKDAAKIAGLNVLKLISEPTAAAFAFMEKNNDLKNPTVLVFDLGGGTFDVSLIKFHNNNNVKKGEVLSISGDGQLGGRDFDNNLFSYFVDEIEKLYDIRLDDNKLNRRSFRRIRSLCEKIKKTLSESEKTYLELLEFLGHNINVEITRSQFEKLNKKLFEKTIPIVDEVLKNANIKKDEVDEVLLVGGSTRIPKIQKMVGDYFGGKTLNKSVNPDEAVAQGAAIQAALLNDIPEQKIDHYSLVDVTPFSLGIEVRDGMFSPIIRRNTKIPVSETKKYQTTYDNQNIVNIKVYEGESKRIRDNVLLGEFEIKDITLKPKGQVEVKVRFEMDADGILNVKATESSKGISKDLNIVLHDGRLTEEQIENMKARIEGNDID